jgi:hypothetical protein
VAILPLNGIKAGLPRVALLFLLFIILLQHNHDTMKPLDEL